MTREKFTSPSGNLSREFGKRWRKGTFQLTGTAFAVALALGGNPSLAQTAQNTKSAAAAQVNDDSIPEIVVTAQFRAQNVQDTPIAITAITGDLLRARNQTDIASVAERAPGVQLTTGGLGGSQVTTISIRGIGQTDFDLGLEPGVGTYIDDVYYGTLFGSLFDLVDLDRVEILRGPQGTLAGKNSEGGAIKLYSKQPTDEADGYIEGIMGTYKRREIRAGGNFTLIPDHLLVRVTGIGEHIDGYVKDFDYQCATGNPPYGGTTGQTGSMALAPRGVPPDGCQLSTQGGKQVVAVRAVVKAIITDDITDTLTYDDTIDHSDSPPVVLTAQGNQFANNGTLAANFVPPAGSYWNYSTSCGLVGTPYQYCAQPISNIDAWGVANNFNWNFGHGYSFQWIGAVRNFTQEAASDQDGSPLSFLMNTWNLRYRQYSQELRFNGSFLEKFRYTVGAYFFQYSADQNARVSLDGALNGTPIQTTFDFLEYDPVHNDSKSAFAHLEYNPIDRLTLTLGGRYTKDYKSFEYGRARAPGYPGTFLDGSVVPVNGLVGVFKGHRNDYSFTADYKWTPDVSTYFSTGTGFKGGGVGPRPYYATQTRAFNPEVVTSYEVGLKSDWFNRTLRFNVSLYDNIYHQIQLTLGSCPQFVPPGLPDQCALPANVGDATIKGLEVETEYHPIANAVIDFSGTYTDFKYVRVDSATRITTDMSPPLVPNFKAAMGAQYKFEFGDKFGSITPRLDFNYIARQQERAVNIPTSWNPGYGLLNGRVSWNNPAGNTTISVEANNLTNKYYSIVRASNFAPVSNYAFASINPGPPRMVAVSLRRTF